LWTQVEQIRNILQTFLATYIKVTNENLLGECRILWGERERAAQWFGNVAEFEQGQNRFCQHHMIGKQRVATAVFGQRHHEKMVLHRFVLFELPPAIFFTLCLS